MSAIIAADSRVIVQSIQQINSVITCLLREQGEQREMQSHNSIPLVKPVVSARSSPVRSEGRERAERTLLVKTKTEVAAEKQFLCPVKNCSHSFTRNHNRKNHLRTFHADLEPLNTYGFAIDESSTFLICPIRCLPFSRLYPEISFHRTSIFLLSFLFAHLNSSFADFFERKKSNFNNKIWDCPHPGCKKRYSLKNNMRQHYRKVHSRCILFRYFLFFPSSDTTNLLLNS